jgi:hypothetical protein
MNRSTKQGNHFMQNKVMFLLITLLLGLMLCGTSHADNTWTVGFRGGVSEGDVDDEDFQQYELYINYVLPWRWQSTGGWFLNTHLNGTAGALRGAGETGFIGSLGPGIAVGKAGIPVVLAIGVSPTVLSKDHFDDAELGGKFHFTSHLGVFFQLGQRWELGYRFQHMSNAGLKKTNPGLDMHMFQLGYRF